MKLPSQLGSWINVAAKGTVPDSANATADLSDLIKIVSRELILVKK